MDISSQLRKKRRVQRDKEGKVVYKKQMNNG